MKKISILLCSLPLIALSACAGGEGGSNPPSDTPYLDDTTFNGTTYYDQVETRAKFDHEFERNISETLENGRLNDDYWNTLEGVWQNESSTKPHNGMQNRNLFYVRDGEETYLGFRGRGLYCQDADLRRTDDGQAYPEGACIITKNKLVPGRFEIEMAAFPRHGGVSACWTYMTETGNELTSQHEIDIEIGGESGNSTFQTFWATSWTKKENKQTIAPDTSSLVYMNDGKFHKYTFDWYTEYPEDNDGRVDWFIDGVLIASIHGGVVTDKEMPLWIGLWFPNWTNNATFDTDYMLMKSFNFTAFDNSQYYEETRAGSGYTQRDPSASSIGSKEYSEIKNLNKIANSSFETFDRVPLTGDIHGWKEIEISEGSISQGSDPSTGSHNLHMDATNGPVYIQQTIEEVYPGYKYDISFDGKLLASGAARAEVYFTNRTGGQLNQNKVTINLDSSSYKTYTTSVEAPTNSHGMVVRFSTTAGQAEFDNVVATYTGND